MRACVPDIAIFIPSYGLFQQERIKETKELRWKRGKGGDGVGWIEMKKRELVIFIETPLRGLCVSKLLLKSVHTGPYPMPSIY